MPLTDSLIAWWDLEEASGSRVDAHGANDLSDNNSVGQAVGKAGNCGDFETTSSHTLSLTDNTDLSMGDIDFTLTFWLNLESKGAHRTAIGKWNASANAREYNAGFQNTLDRIAFAVSSDGTAGGVGEVFADSIGSPSLSTWYHVIAWHDSVNNTISVRVSTESAFGSVDSIGHTTGVTDKSAVFVIGGLTTSSNLFDGLIDSVGIWKRILTTVEQQALWNSGNGLNYAGVLAGGSPTLEQESFRWRNDDGGE